MLRIGYVAAGDPGRGPSAMPAHGPPPGSLREPSSPFQGEVKIIVPSSHASDVDDQFAGARHPAGIAFEQHRGRAVLLDQRRAGDARAGTEIGALVDRAGLRL